MRVRNLADIPDKSIICRQHRYASQSTFQSDNDIMAIQGQWPAG